METKVSRERVTFNNNNLEIVGNLFFPENFDPSVKYRAIVCVHPGGGVKEQTSGPYAKRLAGRGFIALAYDASHQGESEGYPRYLEDPSQRVEDVKCAVDFLTVLPYVDTNRIGAMGICAGAGYAVCATITDRRIKAVATVSMVDIGTVFRETWNRDAGVEKQLELLEEVAQQRTAEANGAEPKLVHYVPEKDEINESTHPEMVEAHYLYRTERGQHPNSVNLFLFSSNGKILNFDCFAFADSYLTQPVLTIVGDKASSIHHSERLLSLAQGKKELYRVEDAIHFDLYDKPEYMKIATDKMEEFFKHNL